MMACKKHRKKYKSGNIFIVILTIFAIAVLMQGQSESEDEGFVVETLSFHEFESECRESGGIFLQDGTEATSTCICDNDEAVFNHVEDVADWRGCYSVD